MVTRLIEEARGILGAEEITDKGYRQLKVIRGQLEGKETLLAGLDEQILEVSDIADIEGDILQSNEILCSITEITHEIRQRTERSAPAERSDPVTVEANRDNSSVQSSPTRSPSLSPTPSRNEEQNESRASNTPSVTMGCVKPKLLKLHIAKFAGDVTKFRTFWDSFDSAVNQNPSLSAIDKFNYLQGLLDGPATAAIQGLTPSEANYTTALDLLKEHFGKTQQVISAHMDQLLRLPSCVGDKASQIRTVYDKISVHVRGLDALGVRAEQYGSFLIPVIMSKLPAEIRLHIARVTTQEVWTIEELLRVIKGEVEARELSEGIKIQETKKSETLNRGAIPTASALVVRETGGNQKKVCVYCKGEHYSASCEKVKEVTARKDVLRKEGRCFLCLANGHRVSNCSSPRRCRRCGRKHHQSLCTQNIADQNIGTASNTTSDTTTPTTTCTARSVKTHVLLQTARTFAYTADEKLVPIRVLMDNGSQRSYVTDKLKSQLQLKPIKQERIVLNTFGNNSFQRRECEQIQVRLQGKYEEDVVITAASFPTICSPLQTMVEVNQYQHLQGLELADCNYSDHDTSGNNIDMLIGSDFYWDVVIGDLVRAEKGPVAVSSKFGWLLSGPMKVNQSKGDFVISNIIIEGTEPEEVQGSSDTDVVEALQRFWDTENIGINEASPGEALDNFPPSITFDWNQERYRICLEWISTLRPSTDAYHMCRSRLYQLRNRLKKDDALLQEYNLVFQKQLTDGIIEIVPAQGNKRGNQYFIPHHGVVRWDKETTKLRVVFDGSARASQGDLSLNECLEKGQNMTPHIFEILLRFRSHLIGIIADIEKAFHQIVIDEGDRDFLRFLWFDNITDIKPRIIQYRFTRLVFGLTPSPAILNSVIQTHLTRFLLSEPILSRQLAEGLYVDDFTCGAGTVEEGFSIYKGAKQLMKRGGFNLRKWHSNSVDLQQRIDQLENANKSQSYSTQVKILGISWDTNNDSFYFESKNIVSYMQSLTPTKRSILRLSAKIFDPLGF